MRWEAFSLPAPSLIILAALLLELDQVQPTSTQLFDKQKQGQQAGLWRGFFRVITEGLNNSAQLAEGSSHLEGHQAQARVRQIINKNGEEKEAKTNRGFWNGVHFMAFLLNIQLYTCTHTHILKESPHICVFKQFWYHGETSEEALDRSRQKRKHDTGQRNWLFTQKYEHFTDPFSSTFFLSVQNLQIQNGVTVIKKKKIKHSNLEESEKNRQTICYYLQPL